MSIQKSFDIGISGPEKKKGWFSWRHPNNVAHEAAKARRMARLEAWQKSFLTIALARAERSPKMQLALLDKRLGRGQGAAKERARLLKQIGAN